MLSPDQCPSWPHAEQVEVRFRSSMLRRPENLRPKVDAWSFFEVTVRDLSELCKVFLGQLSWVFFLTSIIFFFGHRRQICPIAFRFNCIFELCICWQIALHMFRLGLEGSPRTTFPLRGGFSRKAWGGLQRGHGRASWGPRWTIWWSTLAVTFATVCSSYCQGKTKEDIGGLGLKSGNWRHKLSYIFSCCRSLPAPMRTKSWRSVRRKKTSLKDTVAARLSIVHGRSLKCPRSPRRARCACSCSCSSIVALSLGHCVSHSQSRSAACASETKHDVARGHAAHLKCTARHPCDWSASDRSALPQIQLQLETNREPAPFRLLSCSSWTASPKSGPYAQTCWRLSNPSVDIAMLEALERPLHAISLRERVHGHFSMKFRYHLTSSSCHSTTASSHSTVLRCHHSWRRRWNPLNLQLDQGVHELLDHEKHWSFHVAVQSAQDRQLGQTWAPHSQHARRNFRS